MLYAAASPWCSSTARLTLLVMVGTVAATVMLYVKTPKGFFPQDDTGFIFGVTEAAPDISFETMNELQPKRRAMVRRDPAVARWLVDRFLVVQRVRQRRLACSSASNPRARR